MNFKLIIATGKSDGTRIDFTEHHEKDVECDKGENK